MPYYSQGPLQHIERYNRGGLIYKTIGRPLLRYSLKYSPQLTAFGALTKGFYNSNRYRMPYISTGLTTSTHTPYRKKKTFRRTKKYGKTSKKKVLTKSIQKSMPARKTYRKRKYVPKNRILARRGIPRTLVPNTRLLKLKFCDRVAMTGTTGAIDSNVINTNNIIDPLGADSTQQPYYLEQLKTLYRSAVVVGCKASVTFHNTSSTVPCVVGLYLTPWDNSTSITSYEHWKEMSTRGRQRILSSDMDVCNLSQKVSVRKHFGVRNLTDGDEFITDLETETAPSKIGYLIYFLQALDQSSTATGEAIISVEYIVKCMNAYQPARSTA